MDNISGPDKDFLNLIHNLLNEEFELGLESNVRFSIGGSTFEFDLVDKANHVYVEIKESTNPNSRAHVSRQVLGKFQNIAKNNSQARFYLIFTNSITNSERNYYLNFFKTSLSSQIQVLDKDDVIRLAKKQGKLNDLNDEKNLSLDSDNKFDNDTPFDSTMSGLGGGGGEKRYWAGGFGKGEQFYERLEDFKNDNYWQALDYDEDSNQSVAENAWSLFRQIKIGDWFLIKGYGGGQSMNVHYIGEVIGKDENIGRLNFLSLNIIPYKISPPKGEGAGNWFLTLLEVHRKDDIQELFYAPRSKGEKEEPSLQNDVIISSVDFSVSEGDESVIGADELALIMADLLKKLKETDKGKMVGIFGNWGRGKTFLMDRIWNHLKTAESKPFIKIDFHAWKYQDTPASWAYLYEAFAKEYFRKNEKKSALINEIENFYKLLYLNYKRLGIKPFLWTIFFASIAVLGYKLTKDINQVFRFFVFFSGISAATLQLFHVFKKSFSKEAKQLFKKYYSKTSFSNLLGVQAEIQSELKLLLKTWLGDKKNGLKQRILLFVDDIDRCNEERIMVIIDALRVMLEDEEISKRVVVIAAIDERVLKRAIKWKYHDLLIKDCEIDEKVRMSLSKSITNEYMDKLFLSGINLGALTTNERKAILSKYIGNRVYRIKANSGPKESNIDFNEVNASNYSNKTSSYNENVSPMNAQKNDEIDMSNFDLTTEEETSLSMLMDYPETLTPRQIRIFYYRYLLARNILNSKLISISEKPEKELLNNLAKLLMDYTIIGNNNDIKNNKLHLISNGGEGTEFTLLGKKELFKTSELILLHETLEIVIAY
ncbi:MAG: P-loop NTPase fold protein [Bacteroidia bacterium]